MQACRKTWDINLYVNLPPAPNLHNCTRTRLLFEVLIARVEVVEVKNKLEKLLKE